MSLNMGRLGGEACRLYRAPAYLGKVETMVLELSWTMMGRQVIVGVEAREGGASDGTAD